MFSRKSPQKARRVFGVVNGPNLNRLGIGRSAEHYGTTTLDELEDQLSQLADAHECHLLFYQSQHEGQLIDFIHNHDDQVDGWILNPGALMMYGYSLADAIEDATAPVIEVHISQIARRESKRHHSVLADVCLGQISGLGITGYKLALLAFLDTQIS